MNYDFEIDRICEEIKKADAKRVGLQFPDGLKKYSVDIAKEIEKKTGATVIIFADPCYGACDTRELEADKLGIDLMIQFGHDRFY